MHKIFRGPVDNQHFKDTIAEGQPFTDVANFLPGEEKGRAEKTSKDGLIRCWGSIPGESNIRNFEKLSEGDEFLCYRSGHYIALCTIAFKTINPQLARYLWGETETKKTWELVYFFSNVQLFKIDSSLINKEFGFKDSAVMGFNAINEEKTKEFVNKHKTVKNFISKLGVEEKLENRISEEIKKVKINSPFEAQYYLVDLGNQLEFNTYVPSSDAGRSAFSKKLNELITVRKEELKEYVAPVIFDPLSHIDVIWFKDHYQPKFFFEVIHRSGWSEAFLRLDLATKHYETSKARIIGAKDNEEEFGNAIRKWKGPKDNFEYRDYDQLISVHSETLYHRRLINEFLS